MHYNVPSLTGVKTKNFPTSLLFENRKCLIVSPPFILVITIIYLVSRHDLLLDVQSLSIHVSLFLYLFVSSSSVSRTLN